MIYFIDILQSPYLYRRTMMKETFFLSLARNSFRIQSFFAYISINKDRDWDAGAGKKEIFESILIYRY